PRRIAVRLRPCRNALGATGLVVLLLVSPSFGQTPRRPPPAAPKDFAVMAWGSSPSDAEPLRGMREAGLNISGFCRVKDLENVRAAGVSWFVSDEFLDRNSQTGLPPDDQLRRHIADLKKEIGDNPAALGFFLSDEPDAPSMPGLGKLAAIMREAMPDKWPYV